MTPLFRARHADASPMADVRHNSPPCVRAEDTRV